MNRTKLIAVGLVATSFALASVQAAAQALTPAQQEKLNHIKDQFVPGGKSNTHGYGYGKVNEFCGATIPMELHPSLFQLETDPKRAADRTDIDSTCQAFANAVVYTCGHERDADPVVKEIIRTNVKKMICRASTDGAALGNYGVKYALEGDALVATVRAEGGRINGSSIQEEGEKFLRKNLRKGPNGITIGGQQWKRRLLEYATLEKSTLRKALKDDCGMEFPIVIEDKLAEHYSNNQGHNGLTACEAGMQVIYNSCGRANEGDSLASPNIKAVTKKNLKGISCVYSDTESIAVRPGGILEFGTSKGAPRPKWNGRTLISIHDYYFEWMKANIDSLGSGGQPAAAAPASDAAAPSKTTKPKKKKR